MNKDISILDILLCSEMYLDCNYESTEFKRLHDALNEKIEAINYNGDLLEDNNGINELLLQVKKDYYKAGFCTAVKLMLESTRN